ncbi:MAG: type II toxin-antitoxin system VapC family toxin [Bacteroidetes bacterium]|nr:type II toxin-antitoxin system VapC family toxin [Bacteroidota bacterium]
MEDRSIIIDTSILIEFLRSKNKYQTALWSLKENYFCYTTSVTVFELYCGAKTDVHTHDLEKLFRWLNILSFDEESAKLSSQIYRELKAKNQLIEYRDIFIAATAIKSGYTLATLNTKHFDRISRLSLLTIGS